MFEGHEAFKSGVTERRLVRHLREFHALEKPQKGLGGSTVVNNYYNAVDTAFVVASDAHPMVVEAAHNMPNGFVCDGIDDHEEIFAAFEHVWNDNNTPFKRVILSSGTFWVSEGRVDIPGATVLQGAGQMATFIRNQDVGTIHDSPSSNNGVFLIHVEQDSELCDLSIWTDFAFQGTCVISNYGLVHDINHLGGWAQRFLYIQGSIGPTYNLRSWGTYNQVPVADRRACIETNENWFSLVGVYMSINGGGLWVGDHQGGASITGMAIEKNGAEPAVFLGDAGYIAMGDISIRDFLGDGPGIVCESPFFVSLSNINIQGTTVGLAAAEGFWGPNILDIDNFVVKPFVSGIDFYLDDASGFANDVSIKGFRCDGSQSGKGAGWGIRMGSFFGSGKWLISDFDIEGMDEDGILLLNGPVDGAILHDGILTGIGKHGAVLDGISAQVHDVLVHSAGMAAANTYDAFHLKGEMVQPRIHDNKIAGEGQLRYGINISESSVQSAIVIGNSGEDPSSFGTDALNNQGTGTQLTHLSDPAYGDNFFVTSLVQVVSVGTISETETLVGAGGDKSTSVGTIDETDELIPVGVNNPVGTIDENDSLVSIVQS